MSYDSIEDTQAHIHEVRERMEEIVGSLRYRSAVHDRSKLEEPEKSMYDEFVPKLKSLVYGSDEYKATLVEMGAALKHHYAVNSHHPEAHERGIRGMDLLDVVEMFADWAASISRVKDGDLRVSIVKNQERFGYTDELREILLNTADSMGW